ncbi:MAG: SRPBCC domain-containing protein, partial [Mycobacterium sp.]
PDDRVVQAIDFGSDDPSFAGTMIMTWTVREVDGGTRVDMRADHVPPGIAAEDHVAGMTSSLSNLATYMAGPHSSPD